NRMRDTVTFLGVDLHDGCDQSPDGLAGAVAASVAVLQPGITCTKSCSTFGSGDAAIIRFSGSVSNSGNVPLINVMVFDDKPVPGTLVTNFGSTVLAPGATFAYSNFYASACGTNIDTITVSGTELNLRQPVVSNVTSSCSSTCVVP